MSVLYRIIGIGLIGVSGIAIAAPWATGEWSLQFLSLFVFAAGLADLYATISNPLTRVRPVAFATGALAIAAGLLLFLSPSLAVSAVVVLLFLFLVLDGVLKVGRAVVGSLTGPPRIVAFANGVSSLLLASLGWVLWQLAGASFAVGFAVAGYTAATGWRMLVSRAGSQTGESDADNVHPDPNLNLGQHDLFRTTRKLRAASADAVLRAQGSTLLMIGVVLFATHLARMRSYDTWLGLASPFVATAGDVFMAVALGALLVLPARLAWRRLLRPLERKAWQLRFSGQDAEMDALPRLLVRQWTDSRFFFSESLATARVSLPSAGALAIRLGLPLAVLFVAINPIWGFSWYFNTESWASGFYQKMTELRVDKWRAGMVDAVASANGGEGRRLFRVDPPGIDEQDFSFIVIGDPGEGDPSQYALVERYLELGRQELVKFLVIASDVIYPAGAMSDYENNFYLPFKGFAKPIYAIPGNHDWFDALEGFNANFLEPDAARAALAARVAADRGLTSTNKDRIDDLLMRAKRLREQYRIQNAKQRGPFFELQTRDFALIAIDTGIQRTVDDRQLAWIKDALERSRGKFTMAIVGHPKYAAGQDTSIGDERFAALCTMLERAGVRVVMAGDTHAFEYYLQDASGGASPGPIHYFVNGGGGAYLSIGGALAWPNSPPTNTWAFYPGPEAVRDKLDAETPAWKQPFWMWIKRFGAWPISVETLSGMFDFNHAPFYQSFMEIRVERSKGQVVFALHGANGPLLWRDLHRSTGLQSDGTGDRPVEIVVEMK